MRFSHLTGSFLSAVVLLCLCSCAAGLGLASSRFGPIDYWSYVQEQYEPVPYDSVTDYRATAIRFTDGTEVVLPALKAHGRR